MCINKKLAGVLIFMLVFALPIPIFSTNGEIQSDALNAALNVDAKAALLMDAGTGEILYEQNANEELPFASVTKIMTMLLILEAVERGQLSLSDQVTVSERASSMGGSQMFLEAGEIQPLENLMEGVAICSANEEHCLEQQ